MPNEPRVQRRTLLQALRIFLFMVFIVVKFFEVNFFYGDCFFSRDYFSLTECTETPWLRRRAIRIFSHGDYFLPQISRIITNYNFLSPTDYTNFYRYAM